jgi:hypothetical protein
MQVSLREQLKAFIKDENIVHALIQEYWALVQVNPGWRIGGFVSMVKTAATF